MVLLLNRLWCRILAFGPVPTAAAFATCSQHHHGQLSSVKFYLRMVEARTSTAAAASTLRFMLLRPLEIGLLSTLAKGLHDVSIQCAIAEEQWRKIMTEGRSPDITDAFDLHTEQFAFVFVLLMVLLTDARRRPSTSIPYVAAARLRRLTLAAEFVDSAFLASMAKTCGSVDVEQVVKHRSALVHALASLGDVGADVIHEVYQTISSERDEVKVAILQVLAMVCRPSSPIITSIALQMGEPSLLVRQTAAKALATLNRDADAAAILASHMKSSPGKGEVIITFKAICQLRPLGLDPMPAVETLLAAMQHDEHIIRQYAAMTLGELGPEIALVAIPMLWTVANSDFSASVRTAAKDSLEKLKGTESWT